MNIITVTHDLRSIISNKLSLFPDNIDKDTNAHHLNWMCNEILKGKITGEKAHRWIGYIQGCLVSYRLETVESMKQINRQ